MARKITYLIDTNIFLEVLLGGARSEECKKFLRMLRDGKVEGVITDFSVHSIIVIMDSLNKIEELKTFLSSLSGYKGLYVYHTTIADEIKATELALVTRLDMDDALQYASAKSVNAAGIVSFDKHFERVEIQRVEPKEITS